MATQKPLKFIHVAKNAGSSIEQIGKEHGLLWGVHDPEYIGDGKQMTLMSRHLIPSKLSPDYLSKYDFFMVVRNPYTRALSQTLFSYRVSTTELLNRNLKFLNLARYPDGGITTEQYKYIIPGVHILHFENLEAEFNALMIEYGLPARLTKHLNKSHNDNGLTVSDFDEAALQSIRNNYAKDFELFGYSYDVPAE
jgi:hypothetical protein